MKTSKYRIRNYGDENQVFGCKVCEIRDDRSRRFVETKNDRANKFSSLSREILDVTVRNGENMLAQWVFHLHIDWGWHFIVLQALVCKSPRKQNISISLILLEIQYSDVVNFIDSYACRVTYEIWFYCYSN